MSVREALEKRLRAEQFKCEQARESGNTREARKWNQQMLRTQTQLEALELGAVAVTVREDTDAEHHDHLLSFVRMRQLELESIEVMLRDDRPLGVRALMDWILKIGNTQAEVGKKAS